MIAHLVWRFVTWEPAGIYATDAPHTSPVFVAFLTTLKITAALSCSKWYYRNAVYALSERVVAALVRFGARDVGPFPRKTSPPPVLARLVGAVR